MSLNPAMIFGEDTAFTLAYLFRCNQVKVVDGDYSYIYVQRSGSSSQHEISRPVKRNCLMLMEIIKIAAEHGIDCRERINDEMDHYMLTSIISDLPLKQRIADVKTAYPLITDPFAFSFFSSRINPFIALGAYLLQKGVIGPGVVLVDTGFKLRKILRR